MTKCEGCPLLMKSWELGTETDDRCPVENGCHLTPDLQNIIRAIINGEWMCKTCERGSLICTPEADKYIQCGKWNQPRGTEKDACSSWGPAWKKHR